MRNVIFQILVLSGFLIGSGNLPIWAIDDAEQTEALVNLFNNTNGAEWFNNDQWIEGPVCDWFGVRCCEGPFCPGGIYVLDLKLEANNLSGPLPSDLGSLRYLEQLWLNGNQLVGEIPASIGEMTRLYFLTLENNVLTGTIPSELGLLSNLSELVMADNRLSGEVPPVIWEIPWLYAVWIQDNRLEGNPLRDIESGGALNLPWLHGNRFSGMIPRKIVRKYWRTNLRISYNAFHTDDPEVLESLSESYFEPDWLSTQTVAPDTGELAEIDSTTLQLSWSGGGPQDLEGRTIIEHALSGASWTTVGETWDRATTTFDLQRPDDALSHHYRLRTVTDAHENNQSTLISDPSDIVTFNQAGYRVLPAVARLQGAGAFFFSTLHAFNSGTTDLEMLLTYTPRSDIEGQAQSTTWTLGAGQAETIDDALEIFFGPFDDENAVGTLLIAVSDGSAEDLFLRSVITAEHNDGRKYGQAFESPAFSDAIQAGTTAHLHVSSGRMRTNTGLVALEPQTQAQIRLVGPIGTPLSGAFEFDGGAGDSTQLNDVAQVFGVDPPEKALLEIDVRQGSLIAYGSILDGNGDIEGTSDPTTVRPFIEGHEIITLLEMGDIIGHEEWAGTASVSNTTEESATITAEFHQRGLPGVTAESIFELQSGETRTFEPFVSELFGLDNVVGTITLETDARGLVATGREFAVFRDAQGVVTGTSGQLIRGLTTRDVLWPDSMYHLIGLRQDRRPSGNRTNLASFNPVSTSATITLELFDHASGQSEGTISFEVGGEELVHLNAVIKEINPNHDENAKRIEVTTTGPVYLQAFQVNSTGDPLTVDVVAQQ